MSDATTLTAPGQQTAPMRARSGFASAVLHSPTGLSGLIIVGMLAVLALASVLGLLPYGPAEQNPSMRLESPSATHLLGTDQFGRDILSRVASGTANSLLVALVAVALATVIGTAAGIVSGYLQGVSDAVIGAVNNVLFAFPSLLLALTLTSVLQRTWFTVAIAIAVVYIPIFVRVTRGPVLTLREVDYISAARATGMGAIGIMARHVLPNISGLLIVQVTLSLSWAVLTEASLSFLGFGTPPPAASLGSMVLDAQTLVVVAPWTMIGPGAVLIALIVGLNLLGDGLRDALDPHSGGR